MSATGHLSNFRARPPLEPRFMLFMNVDNVGREAEAPRRPPSPRSRQLAIISVRIKSPGWRRIRSSKDGLLLCFFWCPRNQLCRFWLGMLPIRGDSQSPCSQPATPSSRLCATEQDHGAWQMDFALHRQFNFTERAVDLHGNVRWSHLIGLPVCNTPA